MIAQILTGPKFKEGHLHDYCKNLGVFFRQYKARKFLDNITFSEFFGLKKNHIKKFVWGTKSYSIIVFTAPAIILTLFVWGKYNGFFRAFSAIYEFILN